MGIADPRYGAEIVTRTGRVYKFDALECMIAFEDAGEVDSAQVHSRWVVDFAQPGQLIRLEEAEFVFAPEVPSPMGLNVYAVKRSASREGLPPGQPVSWAQVVQMARRASP
jgi:copper chaperone NosL